MMKLKVLVVAFALLGATAVANAADNAWFSLESVSTGVTATWGSGQTLIIDKDSSAGLSVTLTIGYNVTAANGALSAWHIDLNSPDAGLSVVGGSLTGLAANATSAEGAGSENAGGNLFTNFGQTFIGANGSTGLVGTFQLTIEKQPGDPLTTRNIFGTFGVSTQADNVGTWYGFVGANPNATFGNALYGFNGYDFGTYTTRPSLPVITINNVPEPATLALLGLGVVCLIRRRKA